MRDGRKGVLEGTVALITGTGGGQGRAAALLFAAEGSIVVGCDVNAEGSEETVRLVRERGGQMTATAPVDLSDSQAVNRWVEEAGKEHGRIDILYNNASAPRGGTVSDMSDEDWHFTMRNEIDLVFYASRAAWPYLEASGRGVVINTASINGWRASPARQGIAHATAKGGVLAMTREIANAGGPVGIRANSISPGTIMTPTTEKLYSPEERGRRIERQMLKRLGRPEDIAGVALFLASDAAGFMTGADIVVDGGLIAT